MKKAFILVVLMMLSASSTSLFAQKRKAQPKETIELEIIHDAQLAENIKTAQEQLMTDDSRFLGTLMTLGNVAYSMIVGNVVDAGANLLKRSIEKSNSQYKSEWIISVSNDFFYKKISFNSAIDPSDMQFGGFRAMRTIKPFENEDKIDTAFYFSARIRDVNDIVKTSRFTLALDTLLIDLSKTKAKLPRNKTLNLSIEIKITASWVNDATQYYSNQEMGVFTIDLKNIKYNPDTPLFLLTGDDPKGKLSGSCFIIPRSSYGLIDADGRYKSCYGLGEYAMTITIKEQTNNKSVVRDFFENYVIKVTETYGNSVKSSKIIETGIDIKMPESSNSKK